MLTFFAFQGIHPGGGRVDPFTDEIYRSAADNLAIVALAAAYIVRPVLSGRVPAFGARLSETRALAFLPH